jgi:hypothetical protein
LVEDKRLLRVRASVSNNFDKPAFEYISLSPNLQRHNSIWQLDPGGFKVYVGVVSGTLPGESGFESRLSVLLRYVSNKKGANMHFIFLSKLPRKRKN